MNSRVCETAGTDPIAFYICGPTASGKSALALEMARKLDGGVDPRYIARRAIRMSTEDATRVMLQVHHKGVGLCGVFTYEVAETKVNQVLDFARQNQHPLQCTLEKA